MHALKKALKQVRKYPKDSSAQVLGKLIKTLNSNEDFDLSSLYEIDYATFELALAVLKEWRLDRYIGAQERSVLLTGEQPARPH